MDFLRLVGVLPFVFVPELYLSKRVSMVLIWRTAAASILNLKLCWEIGGIKNDLWKYITWKPLIMTWKDHSMLYSFDNLSFPHPEQTKIGKGMLKCVNGEIWVLTIMIRLLRFYRCCSLTQYCVCIERTVTSTCEMVVAFFWNCEHFLNYFSLFWVSSSQH